MVVGRKPSFLPTWPSILTCPSVFMTWPLTSPRATDLIETEWKWQWLLGSSLKSSSLHLHNELLVLEVSVIQCRSGLHKGMSNRKWESFGASTWKFATIVFLVPQWFISFPQAACIHFFSRPPKSHSSTSLTQSLESHLLSEVQLALRMQSLGYSSLSTVLYDLKAYMHATCPLPTLLSYNDATGMI